MSRPRLVLSAGAAGLIAFVIGLGLAATMGLHTDEGIYYQSACGLADWLDHLVFSPRRALTPRVITAELGDLGGERMFKSGGFDPHPNLTKVMIITGAEVVTAIRDHQVSRVIAGRFWFIVLFAILAAAIFGFAARAWGALTGWLTVGLFLTVPAVLGYAPIGITDGPVMALTFFTVIDFIASRRTPLRGWATTAFWLTLLFHTKISVLVTILTLALIAFGAPAPRRRELLIRLAAGTAIGLILFVALTPQFWGDPIGRSAHYFAAHFGHYTDPIPIFGQLIPADQNRSLWWLPIFLFAVTLPFLHLLAFLRGLPDFIRAAAGSLRDRAILAGAFVPLLVVALPLASKQPNARYFLAIYPFVAIIAARGLVALTERWSPRPRRLLLTLVVGFAAVQLGLIAPHPLLYASEPLGWIHAPARWGLPVCEEMMEVNAEVVKTLQYELDTYSTIAASPFSVSLPYYWERWIRVDRQGELYTPMLTDDLAKADYLLIPASFHREMEDLIWNGVRPVREFAVLGVPTVRLYRVAGLRTALEALPPSAAPPAPGSWFQALSWLANLVVAMMVIALAVYLFRSHRSRAS